MAILLLCTIALPFSAGTAFAANTNLTNTTTTPNLVNVIDKNTTTINNTKATVNPVVKTTPTNTTTKNTTINTTTVKSSSKNATGSPSSVSFSQAQINTAAAKVTTFVQINHRLPNYVTISNTEVTMPQFLQLITANLLNINKGLNTTVNLKTVNTPSNSTETVKNGDILKAEYLNIAQSIQTTIASTGKAPSYINSSLGKINFNNLIYTFSKILNFQNTNNRLPNYVSATSWANVTNTSNNPEGIDLRPVYICSDNINNVQADTARINDLISALAQLGIKAYDMGIGPNTHDSILSSIPSNAVIVEIYGGVDAGVIAEKSSTWYKNLLGTKTDFLVLTAGETSTIGGYINNDITGLTWLPRASDDNYDASSFTGIAYPAQYLLNNGIHYYAGLTNNNLVQCAEAIYNVAV